MGLKDVFFHEKKGLKEADDKTLDFVLGVVDISNRLDTEDIVVIGTLKGTASVGDAVYVSNPGDDNGSTLLTTVVGIETSPDTMVKEATDCVVALRLKKGKKHNIKKGTVIYTHNATVSEVHNAYISALGDSYIGNKNLELSDVELESLSITDCAELWRMFVWFNTKGTNVNNDESWKKKIDKLADKLCKKILNTDAIYCVYSVDTGEPYLFSRTMKRNDGNYICSPPDIIIFTEAYKTAMSSHFSNEKFEIKKIENGESKDGISNFLGSTFYLNGACGVSVFSEDVAIDASMLVPPPDYSNVERQNIPVTNPNLVRWMLLLGQLGKPNGEDQEIIYTLYYRFMSIELIKANFLIPIQHDSNCPDKSKSGKIVLEKDTTIKFATMKGKYERPAVCMYTDWKRLRMAYGEEWGGLVQPVEGMIQTFDCAINATENIKAGCYISKEMFDKMKEVE